MPDQPTHMLVTIEVWKQIDTLITSLPYRDVYELIDAARGAVQPVSNPVKRECPEEVEEV